MDERMSYAQITIDGRRALLDALVALRAHRDALVLVGAQAIYLYTGDHDVAIVTTTKDSDLVVDPGRLIPDPLLQDAMTSAGFTHDLEGHQGVWLSPDGFPVELLVPAGLQPGSSRGARIPPHGKRAARRVPGLEAATVDHRLMTIAPLDPTDDRREQIKVAGPAALLVAKTHKIGERVERARAGGRDRTIDKDSHDVYRLLAATTTDEVTDGLRALLDHEDTRVPTTWAIDALRWLAAVPGAPLCTMAGRAEAETAGPERQDLVAESTWVLVRDVISQAA